jgi:predicted ATPase
MQYLKSFTLASEQQELEFILAGQGRTLLDMSCYNKMSAYPFHLFPFKGLHHLEFAPVTIIYGGNGSGKSTLLNIIAEKLGIHRSAPFNDSHLMEHYLGFCSFEMYDGTSKPPRGSEIITSDGVFDFLLDLRAMNRGVDRKREELFDEYRATIKDCQDNGYQMRSLDDYDELKRRNEARRATKSQYVSRRLGAVEQETKSNGESAFGYFTHKIKENALYLLDEPENSLSASLQARLADFLSDSARFYGCQFIISTHSPFLLSMKGAKIYDLDAAPAAVRRWSELENVRAYFELFDERRGEFE